MNAFSPVNRPLVKQSYRFPHVTLPHPLATLAVFATYLATIATSCHANQPSSPMNPGIALIQNQKTAKTAMFTIPVNISVTTVVNLRSSSVYLPSSVSSVVILAAAWHGRLTCDQPDAYSTGAIWDRLPNLARAAARTPTRARHDDRGRPPRQHH
jgi:hypothetical protein